MRRRWCFLSWIMDYTEFTSSAKVWRESYDNQLSSINHKIESHYRLPFAMPDDAVNSNGLISYCVHIHLTVCAALPNLDKHYSNYNIPHLKVLSTPTEL
jgi:hypothetical protein